MGKARLNDYRIDIQGLSNNTHDFEFEFDDDFFSLFENSLVSKGNGHCSIELTKTDSMITLKFEVKGEVELICDRSLDPFSYPIEVAQEIRYKYGIEEKELSEDVFVILQDTQSLNVALPLYEFISLEVPMKKLHPRFEGEESEDIIYQSEDEKKDEIDPRWEALKKLK